MLLLKKTLSVFKSKFILVPVVAFGLVAVGAGIGWLTIKDPPVSASGSLKIEKEPGFFEGRNNDSHGATYGQSTTVPNDGTSNTSTNTSKSSKTSTTKPKTSTQTQTQTTPTCDTQKKADYTTQYNNDMQTENDLYAQNQAGSDYQANPGPEDARHQNAINSIQLNYQQKLASIHCS